MSSRLHLRRTDKSEVIKDIVYPNELEGLGKFYDEDRKEICLLIKEGNDSFYQIANRVLSGVLGKDFSSIFTSNSETVRSYPDGSKLYATIYDTQTIKNIVDVCGSSDCLNEFLNKTENVHEVQQGSLKYLLQLYKFIVDNNLELVIY